MHDNNADLNTVDVGLIAGLPLLWKVCFHIELCRRH